MAFRQCHPSYALSLAAIQCLQDLGPFTPMLQAPALESSFLPQIPQDIPSSACLGLPTPASVLEPELCPAPWPRPAFMDLQMLLWSLWCCDSCLGHVQSTPSSCSPQNPQLLPPPIPQMPSPSPHGPILSWLPMREHLFLSSLLPESQASSPTHSCLCSSFETDPPSTSVLTCGFSHCWCFLNYVANSPRVGD